MARGKPFKKGPDSRRAPGGVRAGAGRKPADIVEDIRRKLLTEDAHKARETLVALLKCQNRHVRLQAARTLLEHAIGKPRQAVDLNITEEDGGAEFDHVRVLIRAGRSNLIPPALRHLIEQVERLDELKAAGLTEDGHQRMLEA